MSDSDEPRRTSDEELVAIPRIAAAIGVTPRVVRYWEQLGLINPSDERGKLRYSPRDVATARLVKRLLDAGVGVDGVRMLQDIARTDVARAAEVGDETALARLALELLYRRKAFRESTGMDEEHYPEGRPPPPIHGPGPKGHEAKHRGPGPKGHPKKPR